MAGLLVLGRDQVALLSVYFLISYVIAGWLSGRDRGHAVRRSLAPLTAATIAGLAVIVVPVVLTTLVAAGSNRPSIDFEGAGRGSLHPALFLSMLSPDVFGATGQHGRILGSAKCPLERNRSLYRAEHGPDVPRRSAGRVADLGRGYQRRAVATRRIRVLTVAFVLSVVYALGWYTPVFKLVHATLPGVDLYRRPADAVFLIGFLRQRPRRACAQRDAVGTRAAP